MSFTQDELDAFHSILDQRLCTQRHELEQAFEHRLNALQQQWEDRLEEALSTQLSAIEQLINHRPSLCPVVPAPQYELTHNFDNIEVQTEISWAELIHDIDKTLDERLSTLNESLRSTMKNMEHFLSAQLHNIHKDLLHNPASPYNGTNIQQIFAGIEQLESIIESMQVAMTSNHALLSNRLYHHQQLPLERAHTQQNKPNPTSDEQSLANHQLPLPRTHTEELD